MIYVLLKRPRSIKRALRDDIQFTGAYPARLKGMVTESRDIDLFMYRGCVSMSLFNLLCTVSQIPKFAMNNKGSTLNRDGFKSFVFGELNVITYGPYAGGPGPMRRDFTILSTGWHHVTAWALVEMEGKTYFRYMLRKTGPTKLTLNTKKRTRSYPNKHINNLTAIATEPPSLKQLALRVCEEAREEGHKIFV